MTTSPRSERPGSADSPDKRLRLPGHLGHHLQRGAPRSVPHVAGSRVAAGRGGAACGGVQRAGHCRDAGATHSGARPRSRSGLPRRVRRPGGAGGPCHAPTLGGNRPPACCDGTENAGRPSRSDSPTGRGARSSSPTTPTFAVSMGCRSPSSMTFSPLESQHGARRRRRSVGATAGWDRDRSCVPRGACRCTLPPSEFQRQPAVALRARPDGDHPISEPTRALDNGGLVP